MSGRNMWLASLGTLGALVGIIGAKALLGPVEVAPGEGAAQSQPTDPGRQAGPTASPTATAPSSAAPAPAPTPATFTGELVQTAYGPVQVEITVSDGRITDVVAIASPSGDRRSQQISDAVLPELRSSALSAQSAGISTVSGATYTSDGYQQSLQSAIDKAGL